MEFVFAGTPQIHFRNPCTGSDVPSPCRPLVHACVVRRAVVRRWRLSFHWYITSWWTSSRLLTLVDRWWLLPMMMRRVMMSRRHSLLLCRHRCTRWFWHRRVSLRCRRETTSTNSPATPTSRYVCLPVCLSVSVSVSLLAFPSVCLPDILLVCVPILFKAKVKHWSFIWAAYLNALCR